MTVVIGLLGLSIVVFVHELGHFLAAKASGIEVERFSIGMGKRLVGFRRGGTDYCISLFPIGGFCKMKGEDSYIKALEDDSERIPHSPGSFYAASPWKRIFVAVSGPLMNVLFAVMALSIVWTVGFKSYTEGNRIVLSSEYPELSAGLESLPRPLPADAALLKSGDRILSIEGKPTPDFRSLQTIISRSAAKALSLKVERGGEVLDLSLTPVLLESMGIALAGIQAWTEPLVESVAKGSPAEGAGILEGDKIVAINGTPIPHGVAYRSLMAASPTRLEIDILRSGAPLRLVAFPTQGGGASSLGIAFPVMAVERGAGNPFLGLWKGLEETLESMAEMFRGIALLFKTMNFSEAFAGPARIAVTVGEVAQDGFSAGFREGLASTLRMLSFISLALFLTNLLPIPVLDGGMVVTCAAEIIRGRPLRPRTLYRITMAGLVVVLAIFLFSSYSDIMHFIRR